MERLPEHIMHIILIDNTQSVYNEYYSIYSPIYIYIQSNVVLKMIKFLSVIERKGKHKITVKRV